MQCLCSIKHRVCASLLIYTHDHFFGPWCSPTGTQPMTNVSSSVLLVHLGLSFSSCRRIRPAKWHACVTMADGLPFYNMARVFVPFCRGGRAGVA